MCLDLQTVGIENERIACDAGRFLIGLAEAAVDDKQLPAGLYGAFALLCFDGGMAVYDMSVFRIKAELGQDHANDLLILPKAEIGVFRLCPCALVVNNAAFKGVEHATGERTVVAAPEVPHHVQRRLIVLCPGVFHDHVRIVHETLAGVPHSAVAHARKFAVLGHRYAAVVQEISVAAQVCAADAVDKIHMAVQRLTVAEKVYVLVYQIKLIIVQAVRIVSVNSRPLIRVKGIHSIIEYDRVVFKIASVEHQARVHSVAGVAKDDPAFELEADGVQRDTDVFLRCLTVVFAREVIKRLERYSVATLEQVCVAVVERYSQHREYTCRASRRGAKPQDIVVAPLNVDVRMLHERIEQPRRLGASVENIADYVQLIDGKTLNDIRKRGDNVVGSAGGYDRLQNRVVIAHLV